MEDAHARVVDARYAAELARLIADDPDGLDGRVRLPSDARGQDDDRDHDHGGNRDHNDAKHDPNGPTGHESEPSSDSVLDHTLPRAYDQTTMKRSDQARRAEELAVAREPFVTALVVRAQRPSSVSAGDRGLVLADGTIEGFVGGACAETSVRLHALRVLETGEPIVLRIVPDEDGREPEEGAVTVENPCLSGGALEIFLEPRLPAPRVSVVGDQPIAHALAALGERLGYEIGAEQTDNDLALVVASHGRDEEDSLERALSAGVPYVGLVASRKRGAAVVDELRKRMPEDAARVRTPAGLDIGAATAEEIALSILAEIVSTRSARTTLPEPPVEDHSHCQHHADAGTS